MSFAADRLAFGESVFNGVGFWCQGMKRILASWAQMGGPVRGEGASSGFRGASLLMAPRGPSAPSAPSACRHRAAAAAGRHLLPGPGGRRVRLLRAAAGSPELPLQQQRRVRGEQPGRQPQVAGAGGGHRRPAALPVPALAGHGEWGRGRARSTVMLLVHSFSSGSLRTCGVPLF